MIESKRNLCRGLCCRMTGVVRLSRRCLALSLNFPCSETRQAYAAKTYGRSPWLPEYINAYTIPGHASVIDSSWFFAFEKCCTCDGEWIITSSRTIARLSCPCLLLGWCISGDDRPLVLDGQSYALSLSRLLGSHYFGRLISASCSHQYFLFIIS